MLWADWSTQERFSEPVRYCLNLRCVRVMWKQGQLADAARYEQEDSAGDGVKENRKFHGWRHDEDRAGVVDRAVLSEGGERADTSGLEYHPDAFNAWSFCVILNCVHCLQSSTLEAPITSPRASNKRGYALLPISRQRDRLAAKRSI